jgi:hypothetical protein
VHLPLLQHATTRELLSLSCKSWYADVPATPSVLALQARKHIPAELKLVEFCG